MNTESRMRTELFTQLIIKGVETPPICVFLDDGNTLTMAFEKLSFAYELRHKDEPWVNTLLHELQGYAEVLEEVGEMKMKTDITSELTFSFYVQTVPMTRFV